MHTAAQAKLTELWKTPHTLHGMLGTVDHKHIGKRYLATAIAFLIIGGIEALLVRLQLAQPQQSLLSPEQYNQIFSMHGITMIFWYASPILSGFAVYVIPLMIGARDLAFPRLNAFTYWTYLLSGVLLYISPFLGQAPHGGWFAYVPFTNVQYSPAYGMDFFNTALLLLTVSTTGGAINFIVTIFRLRCPGMTVSRMPLFLYSTLTTSVVTLFAMPALTACNIMLELDRRWHTHFFMFQHGGHPVLWQQMFWFFGHPWVYIIFLPATGMISMLLPVYSRRPIVGHPYVAMATVLTGVVGFGVWVHHMFATGMGEMAMSFFSAASMTISIFTIVQIFAWVATMWRGAPVLTASMHWALGFIALLVVGGLNGVITAVVPLDWQITDTYWVVSHLHYVLVGANLFPVVAGFYYWLPKITGRKLDERIGKISFWISFIGFNMAFFTMQILGVKGMPRRIYTYLPGMGWGGLNLLVTIGAFVLGIGLLLSLLNYFWSLKHGEMAGHDPWKADTLEWSSESPPPPYGTVHLPTVTSRHPLWDPHEEEHDPEGERILDQGRLTFQTSVLDAEVESIAVMPEDTILPLVLGLLFFVLFLALTFQWMWLAALAVAGSLVTVAMWLWPKPEPKALEV